MSEELCGKWMPRKQTNCARGLKHGGPCATAQAMENHRVRRRARERNDPPEAIRRWKRKHLLASYGLTQEDFDRLLAAQGYRCAMCPTPFEDGRPIFIDHDHACCPDEKRSCGKCVRGLLCLSCNTALGHIERKYELARAYLANSPVGRRGFEPLASSVSGKRAPTAPTARDAAEPTLIATPRDYQKLIAHTIR
jgi:Recombination endonuclease VII